MFATRNIDPFERKSDIITKNTWLFTQPLHDNYILIHSYKKFFTTKLRNDSKPLI